MTSTFVFSKILMSYTWWPKWSSQCLGGEGRRNRAHLQWDRGQPGILETVSMTTNHSKILTLTAKSCVGKPCWNFLPSHRCTTISPSLSSSPVLALFALSHVGTPTVLYGFWPCRGHALLLHKQHRTSTSYGLLIHEGSPHTWGARHCGLCL